MTKKTYEVPQVHYSCWGHGPKEYWRDVSSIAAFIGARLSYELPECNRNYHSESRVSTIRVSQHKEKWGDVRVYVTLADEDLVKDSWRVYRELFKDKELPEEPAPEFIAECLFRDACHYRVCYYDMVALVPHYEAMITGAADEDMLLYKGEAELEARIAELVALDEKYEKANHVKHICERWGVPDLDGLRAYMKKVYESVG